MHIRAKRLRPLPSLALACLCLASGQACFFRPAPREKGTGGVVTPREERLAGLVEPVFGTGAESPPAVDLAPWLPPAGDQGTQNACVGFALGYGLKTFHEARERGWDVTVESRQISPSYIFDRINLGCDVGASIKDGLDLLINEGCPTIELAPYDPDGCSAQVDAAISEEDRFRIRSYKLIAVDDLETVKAFLAAEVPVVVGFRVFDSWFDLSAENSVYDAAVGGEARNHVVLAVGYDDQRSAIKVLNSFGTEWGDGGYAWVDYDLWPRVVKIAYVTEDEEANPRLSLRAPVSFDTEVSPYRIELGDLDGDGDLDFVALSFSEGRFAVLLNDGLGSFGEAVVHPVGEGPFALALGDLDQDGDLDAVTANLYDADVSISFNDGQGTFTTVAHPVGGSFLSDIALADFDGDGDLDMATVNFSRIEIEEDIVVSMNNGDGTFAPADSFGGGNVGRALVIAGDFDGDDDQDLVTMNGLSNDFSVFFNDGSGAFSEAANYAHDSGVPFASIAADLDGDGDLDLIVADTFNNSLTVLANNGDGSFSAPTSYAIGGERPFDVMTGDLDNDGFLDIVVTNPDSDDLSVIMNNGDGTFAEPITFGTGGLGPIGLALGDMDNDGDVDLVVGNNALHDASVLLNALVP